MRSKNITIKYSNYIDKVFNDVEIEIIKDSLFTQIKITKKKRWGKFETVLIDFNSPEKRKFKIYDTKDKTTFYTNKFWPDVEVRKQ